MDWLPNIRLDGVPWWAAFALMLLTFLATKGVDGVLKIWMFIFDREKYFDTQKKSGEDALRKAHEDRIAALENSHLALTGKLEKTEAEHVKCQIEQERLRGQVNVLNEKVERLEGHDKNNIENTKKLAEIVKKETGKAPEIV